MDWDTQQILALVKDWYGTDHLRLRVQRIEDEIADFETEHSEVPSFLWRFVNHYTRIVHKWSRVDLCVELVVFDEDSQSHKLVQDVCFKDAYPNDVVWRTAIRDLIESSQRVWVVEHCE